MRQKCVKNPNKFKKMPKKSQKIEKIDKNQLRPMMYQNLHVMTIKGDPKRVVNMFVACLRHFQKQYGSILPCFALANLYAFSAYF
jgi:hypothetical protein